MVSALSRTHTEPFPQTEKEEREPTIYRKCAPI